MKLRIAFVSLFFAQGAWAAPLTLDCRNTDGHTAYAVFDSKLIDIDEPQPQFARIRFAINGGAATRWRTKNFMFLQFSDSSYLEFRATNVNYGVFFRFNADQSAAQAEFNPERGTLYNMDCQVLR